MAAASRRGPSVGAGSAGGDSHTPRRLGQLIRLHVTATARHGSEHNLVLAPLTFTARGSIGAGDVCRSLPAGVLTALALHLLASGISSQLCNVCLTWR